MSVIKVATRAVTNNPAKLNTPFMIPEVNLGGFAVEVPAASTRDGEEPLKHFVIDNKLGRSRTACPAQPRSIFI
jgi:hypothetical protein